MSLCCEACLRHADKPDCPGTSSGPGSSPDILILWSLVHLSTSLRVRTRSCSSPSPKCLMWAEHWVNVRWGTGWVHGWEVNRKVGNARTPSWSHKRASGVQSLVFQKKNSPEIILLCQLHKHVSESSHCTDGFLEKGEARAYLLPSFITLALCLNWLLDRPFWKCNHSSVMKTRSMI